MTRIGVTGQDARAAVGTIEALGGDAIRGSPTVVLEADVDVVVALGSEALFDLVSVGVAGPVLPIDAGRGVESVPLDRLDSALHELVAEDHDTTAVPLLTIVVDDVTYRALSDVMVVTSKPARISEYGIHTTAEDEPATVDTVRADGVVVATPRGSHEYASDAGGPILAPDSNTVSVVPIAPFRIERTHWGLTPPLTISIERDESDVSLIVDDTNHGTLDDHATIEVTWGETLHLVRVSASRSYFA